MDPKVVGALIGLGGTIAALVIRDVGLRLYLFYEARRYHVSDQQVEQRRLRHDTVRQYADPLAQASRSLMYRVNEIVNKGPATYLLPTAPQNHYVVYKRITTLYRLAAALGWIRAFRTERSYLDPAEASEAGPVGEAIDLCEQALADGQDVEMCRLRELMGLWHVATDGVTQETLRSLATEIDNLRHKALIEAGVSIASELGANDRTELCEECASIMRERLRSDIPDALIAAETKRAIVFLAIREACLYRDWQSAIGDAMLHTVSDAPRRFDRYGVRRLRGAIPEVSIRSGQLPLAFSARTHLRWS